MLSMSQGLIVTEVSFSIDPKIDLRIDLDLTVVTAQHTVTTKMDRQ